MITVRVVEHMALIERDGEPLVEMRFTGRLGADDLREIAALVATLEPPPLPT